MLRTLFTPPFNIDEAERTNNQAPSLSCGKAEEQVTSLFNTCDPLEWHGSKGNASIKDYGKAATKENILACLYEQRTVSLKVASR